MKNYTIQLVNPKTSTIEKEYYFECSDEKIEDLKDILRSLENLSKE